MLNNASAPLVKSYFNMMVDAFGSPSRFGIFVQSVSQYLPTRVLNYLSDTVPAQRLERLRQNARDVNKVSQQLIDEKYGALRAGKGRRDVMSLLVQANEAEESAARLNAEEMLAQMRTMMFAGHETTATTLSWCLYELSRDSEMQSRLRAEIRATENRLAEEGDPVFKPSDYTSMPVLSAFIKEILRFHTTVLHIYRQPIKDDVLPLSQPMTTISGKVIQELPIPKGLKLMLSLAGYHRNESIFGEDANTFRASRWEDGTVDDAVNTGGVFGNQLLTFSGGVRACIGWRFALLELQAILVELISTFEFALPPEVAIHRKAAIVMVPIVVGKEELGARLPLRVCLADRSSDEEL
jgi:cytochrome P450